MSLANQDIISRFWIVSDRLKRMRYFGDNFEHIQDPKASCEDLESVCELAQLLCSLVLSNQGFAVLTQACSPNTHLFTIDPVRHENLI